MRTEAVIIHDTKRPERAPVALRERVAAYHQEAVVIDWDAARDNNAIRGCSLAHLKAYRRHAKGRPLLVLEDDAELIPGGWEGWLAIEKLPEDCGLVLLGGDIRKFRRAAGGWYDVIDYAGAHAVVYNTPLLERTPFLLECYEWIAERKMGPHGPGADKTGSCLEHLLWHVMRRHGLRTYCREHHAFTTRAMRSTRSDLPMHQRAKGIFEITACHKGNPPQEV